MTNQKIGTLEYITSGNINVPHCFSTRIGGVSRGYLSSLNLGIHRGDDPGNVVENYRILGNAVGFDPVELVLTRQIHSDIVRKVGKADCGVYMVEGASPECDGLITNEPGVALAVFTADCTPILLFDPVTGAVGAVHAGWRGTVADIAGKAVKAMCEHYGCLPENIRAAIGPNIGGCCFETDRDVPDAVRSVLGDSAEEYIRTTGEKFHVDLKGVNEALLRRSGVADIRVSGECTACRPDRFWSHRITRGERGAQAAIIKCEGGKVL